MLEPTKKVVSSPHVEVADSLQHFIEDGTLRPGEKVPSVRQMAKLRGISPATVVKAYTVLENRGHLKARSQSGYYVRPRPPLAPSRPQLAAPVASPGHTGVSDLAAEVMTTSTDPANVALGWSTPHADFFPNRRVARLLGSIIRDDPAWLGRSALNWAYGPLARAIARRYIADNVPMSHAEVIITLGCTEALNLGLRTVTRPGDAVAIETPTHSILLHILRSLGLQPREIATDPREGMDLVELRRAFASKCVRAVILMTTLQNPLGRCLSDRYKTRLYDLLREFDLPAVEDDVYRELHFSEPRPRPLKAWDREGRVLLCSSFSKTVTPSLRVGWCAPGRYLEPMRRLKIANTMGTPIVLQKTINDFLRMGGYDRHLRTIRRTFSDNVQKFLAVIDRTFPPGTRPTRPEGGFILWVEFPTGVDSVQLFRDALKFHINLAPGPLFSTKGGYVNCIRLNCAIPWTDRVEAAVRKIGDLACGQLHLQPRATPTDGLVGPDGHG